MKKPVMTLAVALFAATAQADTLVGGYGACLSNSLYSQLRSAVARRDEDAFKYLMSHGCIKTKSGIKVSVLGSPKMGTTKVRAYVDGGSVVVYTSTSNISR